MTFIQIINLACAAYLVFLAFMIRPTGAVKFLSVLFFIYVPVLLGLASLVNAYADFMEIPL